MALPLIPIVLGATGRVAVGATLAAVLQRVFLGVLLLKGASIVARTMGVLGLGFLVYEWVLSPALTLADQYWGAMPQQLVAWLRAFGIMEVASIIVSAYAIWAMKRVVLGRRA